MDFGARHLHWYWRQTSFQKDNGHTESWHLCPNGALNLGIQRRMPFGIVGLHAYIFVTILTSFLLSLRSKRTAASPGRIRHGNDRYGNTCVPWKYPGNYTTPRGLIFF